MWEDYVKSRLAQAVNYSKTVCELEVLIKQPYSEALLKLDQKMQELTDENPHFSWCGIYRVVGTSLHLTCYRGEPTPHPIIDIAKGICGAAVAENRTLNIPDVGADERYLSCDFRTKSELVVPIRNSAGFAIGEIDIDSHLPNAFTPEDEKKIEEVAHEISAYVASLIS